VDYKTGISFAVLDVAMVTN